MTCTVLVRSRAGSARTRRGRNLSSARAGGFHGGQKELPLELDPATMQVSRGGRNARCTGDSMRVQRPLAPSDEIVTTGVRFLSEGMKVRRMQANNP